MAPPVRGYAKVPSPGNPAKTEAWALLESARLMEEAKTKGADELLAAVRRNWRLWTIFQASLVDAACTVPAEIRRNLLALADVVDRQSAKLLADPNPAHVGGLVNLNRQIGEGLLEGARSAAAKQQEAAAPPAGSLRESA
jgi:flagellar biosynthesis activator protein FlaF